MAGARSPAHSERDCYCWVNSGNFSAEVVQKQPYYDDSTFFKFS